MGSELTMASRAEVTTKFAREYSRAVKKDKGRILDQVVAVTGWSRDNARRQLTAAAKRPPGRGRQIAKPVRKQRPPKYSYDAIKVLQTLWAASGGQCGKYLAASMSLLLDTALRRRAAGHALPPAGGGARVRPLSGHDRPGDPDPAVRPVRQTAAARTLHLFARGD